MANQKQIILDKPADWDAWITLVQVQATDTQIWDLINPDLAERPILLEEPTLPEYDLPDNPNEFDKVAFKPFKEQLKIFKLKLANYNRQAHALGDLVSFIFDTITTRTAKIIQREEPYLWNLLRALKKHFAPGIAIAETGSTQDCHQILEYVSYNLIDHLENGTAAEGVKVIEDQVPKMMTTDMLSTHFDVPDLDSVTHITKDEPDKEVLIEVKAETELALPLQFSTLVGAALRSKEISAASDTPIPATGPNTAQITRTSYLICTRSIRRIMLKVGYFRSGSYQDVILNIILHQHAFPITILPEGGGKNSTWTKI